MTICDCVFFFFKLATVSFAYRLTTTFNICYKHRPTTGICYCCEGLLLLFYFVVSLRSRQKCFRTETETFVHFSQCIKSLGTGESIWPSYSNYVVLLNPVYGLPLYWVISSILYQLVMTFLFVLHFEVIHDANYI